ncbi:unnamed protein product [marine sediment metagenome]|uniref:Uncharacterized protein n=1 Tax=marine sediment metagenome TaxID=412755 RepID=X0T8A8_9ZZZZ
MPGNKVSTGGKGFNELGGADISIRRTTSMDQSLLFLEFEYIFGISVALVILLMLAFYVIYPYDKDLKE